MYIVQGSDAGKMSLRQEQDEPQATPRFMQGTQAQIKQSRTNTKSTPGTKIKSPGTWTSFAFYDSPPLTRADSTDPAARAAPPPRKKSPKPIPPKSTPHVVATLPRSHPTTTLSARSPNFKFSQKPDAGITEATSSAIQRKLRKGSVVRRNSTVGHTHASAGTLFSADGAFFSPNQDLSSTALPKAQPQPQPQPQAQSQPQLQAQSQSQAFEKADEIRNPRQITHSVDDTEWWEQEHIWKRGATQTPDSIMSATVPPAGRRRNSSSGEIS